MPGCRPPDWAGPGAAAAEVAAAVAEEESPPARRLAPQPHLFPHLVEAGVVVLVGLAALLGAPAKGRLPRGGLPRRLRARGGAPVGSR